MPRLRQLGRELLGPDLHLVSLLGRHQDGKDGGVDRGGGLDSASQDLQLVEILGVEEALVQGRPSVCPCHRVPGRRGFSSHGFCAVAVANGRGSSGFDTIGVRWIERLGHSGQRTQWMRPGHLMRRGPPRTFIILGGGSKG